MKSTNPFSLLSLFSEEEEDPTEKQNVLNKKKTQEKELIQNSEQFILYNEIKRVTNEKDRIVIPAFKKEIVKKIKTGGSKLSDYILLKRLGDIFEVFYTQNQEPIKKNIADEGLYQSTTTYPYYYRFDELTWKATITYNFYFLRGVAFKSIDIKLANDGFIYTLDYCGQSHPHYRHGRGDWYNLLSSEHDKLGSVFQFAKTFGANVEPKIYYNHSYDRLDIQFKDVQTKKSVSVCFEYGHPDHDFDDIWNQI